MTNSFDDIVNNYKSPSPEWKVFINGNDYSDRLDLLEFRYSVNNSLKFDIKLSGIDSTDNIPEDSEVIVSYGGGELFRAVLKEVEPGAFNTYMFKGAGYASELEGDSEEILNDAGVSLPFKDTDIQNVVDNLADGTNVPNSRTFSTSYSGGTASTSVNDFRVRGKQMGDINRLMGEYDAEWYITIDGSNDPVLNITDQIFFSTDANNAAGNPKDILKTYGADQSAERVDHNINRNRGDFDGVVVRGYGDGDDQIKAISGSVGKDSRVLIYTDKTIVSQEEADKKASNLADTNTVSWQEIEVKPSNPNNIYAIGDELKVDSENARLNDNYRVVEAYYKIYPEQDEFESRLNLSNKPQTFVDDFKKTEEQTNSQTDSMQGSRNVWGHNQSNNATGAEPMEIDFKIPPDVVDLTGENKVSNIKLDYSSSAFRSTAGSGSSVEVTETVGESIQQRMDQTNSDSASVDEPANNSNAVAVEASNVKQHNHPVGSSTTSGATDREFFGGFSFGGGNSNVPSDGWYRLGGSVVATNSNPEDDLAHNIRLEINGQTDGSGIGANGVVRDLHFAVLAGDYVANFSFEPESPFTGDSVKFTETSSGALSSNYDWYFYDKFFINSIDTSTDEIFVSGDATNRLSTNDSIDVRDGTLIEDTYTVSALSYDSNADETTVGVSEDITDGTGDYIRHQFRTVDGSAQGDGGQEVSETFNDAGFYEVKMELRDGADDSLLDDVYKEVEVLSTTLNVEEVSEIVDKEADNIGAIDWDVARLKSDKVDASDDHVKLSGSTIKAQTSYTNSPPLVDIDEGDMSSSYSPTSDIGVLFNLMTDGGTNSVDVNFDGTQVISNAGSYEGDSNYFDTSGEQYTWTHTVGSYDVEYVGNSGSNPVEAVFNIPPSDSSFTEIPEGDFYIFEDAGDYFRGFIPHTVTSGPIADCAAFYGGELGSGDTIEETISSSDTSRGTNKTIEVQFAGASDSITVDINSGPTASFTASSTDVTPGETINFDATGSSHPDSGGSITNYEWDWTDDGTYDQSGSSLTNPSHSYSSSGTYTVRLRVTDDLGFTDTATTTITVSNPPTADFTVDDPTPIEGQELEFDASSQNTNTDPGDGTSISEYRWDWNNDQTIDDTTTSATINHTFTTSGDKTVRLVVQADDGDTAETTKSFSSGGEFSSVGSDPTEVTSESFEDSDLEFAFRGDGDRYDSTSGGQFSANSGDWYWSHEGLAEGTEHTSSFDVQGEGELRLWYGVGDSSGGIDFTILVDGEERGTGTIFSGYQELVLGIEGNEEHTIQLKSDGGSRSVYIDDVSWSQVDWNFTQPAVSGAYPFYDFGQQSQDNASIPVEGSVSDAGNPSNTWTYVVNENHDTIPESGSISAMQLYDDGSAFLDPNTDLSMEESQGQDSRFYGPGRYNIYVDAWNGSSYDVLTWDDANNDIEVSGDRTGVFQSGDEIRVDEDPQIDHFYTVSSSSYDSGTDRTTISVNEDMKDFGSQLESLTKVHNTGYQKYASRLFRTYKLKPEITSTNSSFNGSTFDIDVDFQTLTGIGATDLDLILEDSGGAVVDSKTYVSDGFTVEVEEGGSVPVSINGNTVNFAVDNVSDTGEADVTVDGTSQTNITEDEDVYYNISSVADIQYIISDVIVEQDNIDGTLTGEYKAVVFEGGHNPSTQTFTGLSSDTYTVKLEITNNDASGSSNGEIARDTATVDTNTAPTADFTISNSTPDKFETVNLTDTSQDNENNITKWEWDFTSDGTYEETINTSPGDTSVSYSTAGNKDVTLRVTDEGGLQDTVTKTISVQDVETFDRTVRFSGVSDVGATPTDTSSSDLSSQAYSGNLNNPRALRLSGVEHVGAQQSPAEDGVYLREDFYIPYREISEAYEVYVATQGSGSISELGGEVRIQQLNHAHDVPRQDDFSGAEPDVGAGAENKEILLEKSDSSNFESSSINLTSNTNLAKDLSDSTKDTVSDTQDNRTTNDPIYNVDKDILEGATANDYSIEIDGTDRTNEIYGQADSGKNQDSEIKISDYLIHYNITAVDTTNEVFTVIGDVTDDFSNGDSFDVTNSTGNDGSYSVSSISYDSANDETDITVNEDVTDSTADGGITNSPNGLPTVGWHTVNLIPDQPTFVKTRAFLDHHKDSTTS